MPYKLPLTREEFARALDYGLGRALLHARKHGLAGTEEPFLRVCLEDPRYDRQCSADPVPWLGEFFQGAPKWIAGPVFAALSTAPDDARGYLCRMALLLGRRGHPEARAALREAFYERGVLALEGEEGFLWMAAQLGRWAREGSEVGPDLVDTYALACAGATFREQRTAAASLLRSSPDPDVRYYVQYLEENGYGRSLGLKVKGPAPPPHPKDAGEVIARLDSLDREVFYFGPWVNRADPAGLRLLAEKLFQPMPLIRLRSLLRCFRDHGLPAYDPRMMAYADHENAEVRRLTYWILAHHDHEDVRSLALARLRNLSLAPGPALPDEPGPGWPPTLEPRPVEPGTLEPNSLRLFTSTWRAGDERLLLQALRDLPYWDDHRRHNVLSDLVDVLKPNTPLGRLPLLVYEHSPCTVCRSQVVQLMLSLGTLPAWARRECRHDVDEHIRELVR